jgi:hypothetical protein
MSGKVVVGVRLSRLEPCRDMRKEGRSCFETEILIQDYNSI